MRVPLSWLRDFAPIQGDVDALAAALSGLGLVVEGIEQVGEGLDGIVVARVLATRQYPAADRVQLVDVDAGDGESLQIVCGAFNMAPGDLVPLAPLGTVMRDGMQGMFSFRHAFWIRISGTRGASGGRNFPSGAVRRPSCVPVTPMNSSALS